MSVQGHLLDITVIGCRNLKDTEWISRQDPYVILEYAGNKYRTKTDTDGGRNPAFNEKYMLPLIEGLREVNVTVWNSNTLSADDFIGSGKILLQKVLSDGYHDSTWPLTCRRGRRAGEVRIIMHYTNPGKQNVVPCTSAYHEPIHAALPMYPPLQPPGVYTPYPPSGDSPYGPYGTGGYQSAPSYGAQAPYGTYPPQPYPPQPYPPQLHPPQLYPPQQDYGTYPSGAHPPYQGLTR